MFSHHIRCVRVPRDLAHPGSVGDRAHRDLGLRPVACQCDGARRRGAAGTRSALGRRAIPAREIRSVCYTPPPMRTHYCGKLSAELLGQTVTIAGWAHRRRDHGGVIFIDLRDREGLAQVVSDPDRKATFATAEKIRNEFVLKVTGLVRRRPEGTVNPNIASGEVEVLAHDIEILNPSLTPPFQLDDENLSETVRLTHRVIDLRRETMQKNLKLRYRAAMAVRKYLDAHGFIDIETPMLARSTPEGARDYLVPSRVHPGEFYALPQSPQLFKQLLMVAGYDRYYQIVKCFRDEDLRADRQPEFTQIDLEMSFVTAEDVHEVVESLVVSLS